MLFGLIKQGVGNKTSFPTAVMAMLVPFCVFLGSFGNVLYLTFRQQAVPSILNMALRLVGIILGSVFFYLLISKLITSGNPGTGNAAAETGTPAENRGKSSFPAIVLNFLIGSSLVLALRHILPALYQRSDSGSFITAAVILLIIVFLLAIFFISSWKLVHDDAGIKDWFRVLAEAIRLGFGKIRFIAVMYLLIFLSLAAGVLLYELSWSFLKNTSLSLMLSYFYVGSLISCFAAFMLIVILKPVISVFAESSFTPAHINPLPGYIILSVLILGTLYNILPAATSISRKIDNEYSRMLATAEKYRTDDKLYLCGSGYKSAYALTQAYQGYLASQQAAKDKDLSETAKAELLAKAEQFFRTAYGFWPGGGLVYYLDALRQMENNPIYSIELLEKANAISSDFKDSYFIQLGLYKQNKMKDKAGGITDVLIESEAFSQTVLIGGQGIGEIKRLLEKYKENEKFCLENITTSAVFYYENQLYKEAMDELTMLVQVIPDDLVVNYMIAVTDLEIKSDNKPYTAALEASQKILKIYPGEEWAEDFATGIAMRAGNQGIMESSLQESYAKNPDNLDIAEQYAYSILKKNYDFNYSDAAKQAEEIVDGIISKDSSRWFALYCKSTIQLFKREYEGSLASFENFSEIISEDTELHDIYDDFYNLYILKYKELMIHDTKAAKGIASREATNPFLYNYIYGAFLWRNSDYDNSEKYLNTAISLMPDLSKPYFLLGNIYFEKAGVFKLTDYYPKAEEQYRKALSIFPEDPYAWFSLGHVMKKTNRLEEALGAFQKTLTYMPAEDHATDHYGISIHSTYQIQEIKELLKSKEVK